MPEFKVGQLVKAEWPDGQLVVGEVPQYTGSDTALYLRLPTGACYRLTPTISNALEGATFTVVKEPPIEQPTGAFALVQAHGGVVFRRFADGFWVPYGYAEHGGSAMTWKDIQQRVVKVLFPGVTS